MVIDVHGFTHKGTESGNPLNLVSNFSSNLKCLIENLCRLTTRRIRSHVFCGPVLNEEHRARMQNAVNARSAFDGSLQNMHRPGVDICAGTLPKAGSINGSCTYHLLRRYRDAPFNSTSIVAVNVMSYILLSYCVKLRTVGVHEWM